MTRGVLGAFGALVIAGAGACGTYQTFGSDDTITRPPGAAKGWDEAFGAQARVRVHDRLQYFGELLACDPAFIFLHLNALDKGNPYVAIPWRDVSEARVNLRTGQPGGFNAWVIVGTLSAVSHGFYAFFSVPIWLIAGISSALVAASLDHVDGRCVELTPYARYPQGLPPAMRAHFLASPPPWGAPSGVPAVPLHLPPPPPPPAPLPPLPPPSPPPVPQPPAKNESS